MPQIAQTINRKSRRFPVQRFTPLVQLLRPNQTMTGAHVGCATSGCGVCTVLLDGSAAKGCTILAVMADGGSEPPLEGPAEGGTLHPVQETFHRAPGLQCGFCAPDMIRAAIDMLARHGDRLDAVTVDQAQYGNLCPCAGYQNIVTAILATDD